MNMFILALCTSLRLHLAPFCFLQGNAFKAKKVVLCARFWGGGGIHQTDKNLLPQNPDTTGTHQKVTHKT